MFSYTPGGGDRDTVRMLFPDTIEANKIFEDEELDAFLTLEGDVWRATALALETTASDQVLAMKVMTVLNVKTNGRAVSQALLQRAALLRAQATDHEARAGTVFDVIEEVPLGDAAAVRERVWAAWLRQGA